MSSAKYFIWFICLFLISNKLAEQCDGIVNSLSTKLRCNSLLKYFNIWLNTNLLPLIYRTKESAVQLPTAWSVYTLIPNLITLALRHPEIFGVCEPVDYVSIAVRISCIAHCTVRQWGYLRSLYEKSMWKFQFHFSMEFHSRSAVNCAMLITFPEPETGLSNQYGSTATATGVCPHTHTHR